MTSKTQNAENRHLDDHETRFSLWRVYLDRNAGPNQPNIDNNGHAGAGDYSKPEPPELRDYSLDAIARQAARRLSPLVGSLGQQQLRFAITFCRPGGSELSHAA